MTQHRAGIWFKSSYSGNTGNNCVEVANLTATGDVGIRDSKNPAGPTLLVPATAWAAFVTDLRHTPARTS